MLVAMAGLPGSGKSTVAEELARALNHFNKKGKGEYLRAVLTAGPVPSSIDELCAVSTALGWPLRWSGDAELELVVPGTLPPR